MTTRRLDILAVLIVGMLLAACAGAASAQPTPQAAGTSSQHGGGIDAVVKQPENAKESAPAPACSFTSAPAETRSIEITGVQPYALDQPRVPGLLTPAAGGPPLSYQSPIEEDQKESAFEWFLDTAASRIALSKAYRDALGVKATDKTVEDWGIGGAELFDVSLPCQIHVGDSTADPADAAQFPFSMQCVMELRRTDGNALDALPKELERRLVGDAEVGGLSEEDLGELVTPSINILGTPFLEKYVAILDPRPAGLALAAVLGILQQGSGDANAGPFAGFDQLLDRLLEGQPEGADIGQIKVDFLRPDQGYAAPEIVVPLTMKQVTPGPLPVTEGKVPFVSDVTLENGDREVKVALALDTGGAVSLISTRLAQELGLDLKHPDLKALIQGVGKGAPELNGYWINRVTLPVVKGKPIVYRRAPFFVADIKGIDGTIGANLFLASVYLDLSSATIEQDITGILSSLKPGVMPFRRVVLDLPHGRLGLDLASKPPENPTAPPPPKAISQPAVP